MPEGDTIARMARTLGRWLGGRQVTAASGRVRGVAVERLVGDRVGVVESQGKHLLMRFESGRVLHTHMRMQGSWHVYRTGQRWPRPQAQARVVVECGPRLGVCFNAPVVELLVAGAERLHPALTALGPDLVQPAPDFDEVCRRAAARPPTTLIGDVLLDQRVASGIGNVYRCEALFLHGVHPAARLAAVGEEVFSAVVTTAARLLSANARPSAPGRVVAGSGRDVGLGPGRCWVYGRAGRPCRQCGTRVRGQRLGAHARTTYWCPACQPER